MNRGGFSWKRLLGVSRAKSNISRKIGIPLTKSGRNQKVGGIVTKGCLGILAVMSLPLFLMILIIMFKFTT
ncbi:hypothetical protein EI546_12820 [Aequorivita sp. H23M31]|uniref:DUF5808 domain-containing protein n=1 Tax=Aequorivita ciconiae TaxID=2494375 RepID=A0A410G5J3_9FLAO|nr:hypothetical protein EI546_12820 [Aequorivita sp. H23M31]